MAENDDSFSILSDESVFQRKPEPPERPLPSGGLEGLDSVKRPLPAGGLEGLDTSAERSLPSGGLEGLDSVKRPLPSGGLQGLDSVKRPLPSGSLEGLDSVTRPLPSGGLEGLDNPKPSLATEKRQNLPSLSPSGFGGGLDEAEVRPRDEFPSDESTSGESILRGSADSKREKRANPDKADKPAKEYPQPSHKSGTYLSKSQQKRLEKAKKLQRKRVRGCSGEWKKVLQFSNRGEPELKLCSANLRAYSLEKDYRKMTKKSKKYLKRVERSFQKAVLSAGCEVIAVQGILGKNEVRALAGLSHLAEKLSRDSGLVWKGYLGESNHSSAYNGFLIQPDKVTFRKISSHIKKLLPRFSIFQQKKFARSPVEASLLVHGKRGSRPRRLRLYTMHLRKPVGTKESRGAQPYRMQMAEGVRQLASISRKAENPRSRPIYVVLGERDAGRYSPAAEILSGRIKLTDFKGENPCVLDEEGGVSCGESKNRPLEMFGLFESHLQWPVSSAVRKKDKEKTKLYYRWQDWSQRMEEEELFSQSAEMYMFQDDLKYAWQGYSTPGCYQIGTVPLDNGLPNSPLLWVELNW